VLPIGEDIVSLVTAAQMTATATAWVGTIGLSVVSAVPIVGAIVAVGALIFHILGGGCGQTCVDASKVEQVFEAASDNLYLIARAGMMGAAAAVAGQTHFLQTGMTAMQRLQSGAAAVGFINLEKVIGAEIAATKLLPAQATKPLTLPAARALYVGGAGWYADSIQLASQLTDQFVLGHIQSS
jgi:hypothetical protein